MQTATNPQTGERVQWNGSAWVPLDGSATPAPPQQPPGPVTLGTPRPKKPDIRQVGNVLGIVDDHGNFTPTYTAPDKPGKGGGQQLTAEDRGKFQRQLQGAQGLKSRIGEIEQLYQQNFAGGGIGAAAEYLPSTVRPVNGTFNDAGNALMGDLAAAYGLSAQQQNTPTEMKIRFGPFVPQNTDRDERIVAKIQRLKEIADEQERQAREALGIPADQPQASPETAPAQAPQDTGAVVHDANLGGQQLQVSQGGTQTVQNPQLAGVRGEYLSRLARGDSAGELIAFARQAGITDPQLLKSIAQQAQFRRQHPEVPIDKYNTDQLDLMDVPLSATEGAMNDLGQSAVGAYAMRAGNAVTANNLDSIVGMTGGNAERARIGLDQASRNHPVAGMAGDLSGGVMAALGAEAGLGAAGAGAGVGRALAADTLYGASAGAGAADNGDRFSGAVKGGLSGLVGSVGGQAVARGVGSAISPTGGRLADLYEQGVRPTPGQRFVNSGVAGRALNNVEENLGSVPLVGSMIRGARQDARDQWQVAAFNSSLKEIGEKLPKGMKPGTAPHQFAQQKFNAVYDKARSGMKVAADEQLASEVGQLGEQIGNLAEPSIRRFETIIRNTVLRRVGSEIDGEAYKKIQSELGKTIRGIRKSPSGDGELADALDELKGIIDNAARRHSDPEAVALLDAADRGYAKFVQIEQAAGRGGVGKDAGTFSPNDFASAVKGNGQRVRSKAYNQGQGLMQDFAAQGNNLVDRIPNSGSPERLMAAGTLAGGAQYMEPSTLGVLGIIGTLYAPGVRKGLAGAMAPRGPKAKAIADQVRKRARIAGAGGAAALTQTSGGQ